MTNPSPECDHRSTEKGDLISKPMWLAARALALAEPSLFEDKSHTASLQPNERAVTVAHMVVSAYKRHAPSTDQPPAHQENSPRSAGETEKNRTVERPIRERLAATSGPEDGGVTAGETALFPEPAPQVREALTRGHVAALDNLKEAWSALAMIREAVETLAPSGSVKAAEHLDGPTFMHEAEALVAGIVAALSAERPVAQVREALEQIEALSRTPEMTAGLQWGRAYAIAKNALNALTPVVAREPVGWQHIDMEGKPGIITPRRDQGEKWCETGNGRRLYTSPPPASAVREALELLLAAAIKTVEENLYLADGENCTLIHLKRAIATALSIKGTDLKQADETSEKSR